MAGKKGYKATRRLRERGEGKRGGNRRDDFPKGESGSLAAESLHYLESLAVKNYSPRTIEGRRDGLKVFLLWCDARSLEAPENITKLILELSLIHI